MHVNSTYIKKTLYSFFNLTIRQSVMEFYFFFVMFVCDLFIINKFNLSNYIIPIHWTLPHTYYRTVECFRKNYSYNENQITVSKGLVIVSHLYDFISYFKWNLNYESVSCRGANSYFRVVLPSSEHGLFFKVDYESMFYDRN